MEEIFQAAAAARAPEERATLLEQRCAGDPSLRADVESLLAVHDETSGVLDRARAHSLASLAGDDPTTGVPNLDHDQEEVLQVGARVGAYTIRGRLGSGGMGIVYLAEQERPRRTVALKVIRRGLATAAVLRRFEHEADVLGRLQHPGIAQIFEAGAADYGFGPQPYIAMEQVTGPPLLEYADARGLSPDDRLRLIAKVCDAVQHAHTKGVIHRDLKPGNILVVDEEPSTIGSGTPAPAGTGAGGAHGSGHGSAYGLQLGLAESRVGQPKVLDFGVARAIRADAAATTLHTNVGQIVGTVPYMSPEQIAGDPGEIDIRSDVYSIGVMTFELLTGRLPYDVRGKPIPEAARMIRDDDPARLSAVNKTLRGDIETIVRKALDKKKDRRYQSAAALGADILRFLAGEPIEARRDSAMYVLRKQLGRYRGAVAAGIVGIVALLAFGVFALIKAEEARLLAAKEHDARLQAVSAGVIADHQREVAAAKAEELRRTLYVNRIGFAQAAYLAHDIERMKRALADCPEDLRGWEWRFLDRISDTSSRTIHVHPEAWGGAALAGAGETAIIATFHPRAGIKIWNQLTGQELFGLPIDAAAELIGQALDPAGRTLVTFAKAGDITGWDLGERRERWTIRPDAPARRAGAFSPDGAVVAVVGNRRLRLLEPATGAILTEQVFDSEPGAVAFSPDGTVIAVSPGGSITLWSLPQWRELLAFPAHSGGINALAFSPDGARLASCSHDFTVRQWDVATGQPPDGRVGAVRRHTNKVWRVAWSPDGRLIASGGTDAVIHLTDAATGDPVNTLSGHQDTIQAIEFDSRGRLMAYSRAGMIKWWDDPLEQAQPVVRPGFAIYASALLPDGRAIALGSSASRVVIHPIDESAKPIELAGPPGNVRALAIDADGEFLGAAGEHDVRIWRLAEGGDEPPRIVADIAVPTGSINRLAFSRAPDLEHRLLAGTADDGYLRLWEPLTGREVLAINTGQPCFGIGWSPDGTRLVAGGRDGIARVFDAATGGLLRTLAGHAGHVAAAVFAPDGRSILTAGEDPDLLIWEPDSDAPARRLQAHKFSTFAIAVFPDGRRFVTGGYDNMARVWDFETGDELLTLRGHHYAVNGVHLSRDANLIVTTATDLSFRIWDAPPVADH
jgi:WD40 repeat protein/serine/threonine protein kinase